MTGGRRWGLRSIFSGLIVALLLVFGAVVAAVTHFSLKAGYEDQLRARGSSLVNLLARTAAPKLFFNQDGPDISDFLSSVQQDPDVLFTAVTNVSGKVVAQTTQAGFRANLSEMIKLADASSRGWALSPSGDFFILRADSSWAGKRNVATGSGLDEYNNPVVPAPAPAPSAGQAEQRQGAAYIGVSKDKATAAARQALLVLLLVTLGLVLVASFVAFLVTRAVTQPLSAMVDFAVAISGGDYDRVSSVESPTQEVGDLADAFAVMRRSLAQVADQARSIAAGDLSKRVAEAGRLGEAFNAMVASLSGLVGQIKKASIQMASASAEILAASRQAEKGSAEQASSINQTTTTMDELLSASKQIASSADAVVKIAERTLGAAKAGEDAVKMSISGMEEIASNNRQTAERILELSERNQQIGNIVDLIDEIADKSDLLALNAAIEGAKAGEAGKGFAVVATEMRSLAENVVESTKEIKTLITEIQKASNASVLATEGQMKATERGTSIALKTGERLREILQMVEQTTEAAKQISLATQQQRTGTEQVVQSMGEIAKIAKVNVSGATQTTSSTGELAKLAEDLRQAVSQFRLGSDQA